MTSPSSRSISAFASARPTVRAGLVGELDPDPAPRRGLVNLLAEPAQLFVPRRQLGPSRLLFSCAASVESDHGIPGRVEVASGRGKCVGVFRTEEREVSPFCRRTRPRPAAGAGPPARSPVRQKAGDSRRSPAPRDAIRSFASASECWWNRITCGPRAALASIPSAF